MKTILPALFLILATACGSVPVVRGGAMGGRASGVTFTPRDAAAVIDLVNHASFRELDHHVPLDVRAARNIVAARPIRDIHSLDRISGIGPKTLANLIDYTESGR